MDEQHALTGQVAFIVAGLVDPDRGLVELQLGMQILQQRGDPAEGDPPRPVGNVSVEDGLQLVFFP